MIVRPDLWETLYNTRVAAASVSAFDAALFDDTAQDSANASRCCDDVETLVFLGASSLRLGESPRRSLVFLFSRRLGESPRSVSDS